MKTGIISDIHEDIVSLKKALLLIEKQGCNEVVCLGDIVGYAGPYYNYPDTRNADACVEIVRKNCSLAIAGNHDLFHVNRLSGFRAGISYPENWFQMDFNERKRTLGEKIWIYDDDIPIKLSEENRSYLLNCPEYTVYQSDFFLSHYLYPDLSGSGKKFATSSFSIWKHFAFIKNQGCHTGISGHIHANGFQYFSKWFSFHRSFGKLEIKNKVQQFCIPAIGSGKGKSGFAILDIKERSISSFELI